MTADLYLEPPTVTSTPGRSTLAAGSAPAVPAPDSTPGGGISRSLTLLLAVTAGLAVANIYYAQPLLTVIAATFGVSSVTASIVVTVGTVGYALGLGLLVPLADLVDRRRLVVMLLAIVAVGEVAMAAAPSVGALVGIVGPVALCAVVGPIAVSFGATLATPETRGRVTGTVMSGVLLGVLLARTGGGLVALVGGWRLVYLVAAGLMAALAVLLARALPRLRPAAAMSYPALLRSIAPILREEPVVRLRCSYGFFCFAGFSALWTSLAFLLAGSPYHYSPTMIGLFGLAGAAGAYAAKVAGRLTDRGLETTTTAFLLLAVLVGWGLLALDGGHQLWAVIAGVVVLDLGVQGMQTINLAVVFRHRLDARNRITTAYMVTYFLGGVAGSSASALAYSAGGWPGVCVAGASFAVVTLVVLMAATVSDRREGAPAPSRN